MASTRARTPSTRRVATAMLRAGMEMTSYPVLVEVQSEMARMKVIYDLYSAFEKFREDMSLTAWGELDVEVLKEGAISASRHVHETRVHLTFMRVVSFSNLSAFRARSRLDVYHTQVRQGRVAALRLPDF